MAIAAVLATGCGVSLVACLGYAFGRLIQGITVMLFATVSGLSPKMRLFVTAGFCADLITASTSFVKTATLLRPRRPAWTLASGFYS